MKTTKVQAPAQNKRLCAEVRIRVVLLICVLGLITYSWSPYRLTEPSYTTRKHARVDTRPAFQLLVLERCAEQADLVEVSRC
jgi:hypothetical protein